MRPSKAPVIPQRCTFVTRNGKQVEAELLRGAVLNGTATLVNGGTAKIKEIYWRTNIRCQIVLELDN